MDASLSNIRAILMMFEKNDRKLIRRLNVVEEIYGNFLFEE